MPKPNLEKSMALQFRIAHSSPSTSRLNKSKKKEVPTYGSSNSAKGEQKNGLTLQYGLPTKDPLTTVVQTTIFNSLDHVLNDMETAFSIAYCTIHYQLLCSSSLKLQMRTPLHSNSLLKTKKILKHLPTRPFLNKCHWSVPRTSSKALCPLHLGFSSSRDSLSLASWDRHVSA